MGDFLLKANAEELGGGGLLAELVKGLDYEVRRVGGDAGGVAFESVHFGISVVGPLYGKEDGVVKADGLKEGGELVEAFAVKYRIDESSQRRRQRRERLRLLNRRNERRVTTGENAPSGLFPKMRRKRLILLGLPRRRSQSGGRTIFDLSGSLIPMSGGRSGEARGRYGETGARRKEGATGWEKQVGVYMTVAMRRARNREWAEVLKMQFLRCGVTEVERALLCLHRYRAGRERPAGRAGRA